MAVGERLQVIGQYDTPAEATSSVRLALSRHFDELVEAGVRPWSENGKLQVSGHIPPVPGAEDLNDAEHDEAWEQRVTRGGTEGLRIRRDTQTGSVTFASISGDMPATLSGEEAGILFRADLWRTRIYFPPKHAADETQRLVADSWQAPYTQLTHAHNAQKAAPSAERDAAYDDLYKKIIRRHDGAGIPIGAIAISHTVLGRGFSVPEESRDKLNSVMEVFAEGVSDAIVYQRDLARRIASGQE